MMSSDKKEEKKDFLDVNPVPNLVVRSETPSKLSVYPTSRLAPRFEPIDQVEFLKESDKMLGAVVHGKLQVIVDQINFLKAQAKKILEEARMNMDLHRASCSFEKRVGHTYHLYEKQDGTTYFSLLSPEDWKGSPPHPFLGSYKLESDLSWTVLEDLEAEH
jgi:hypothetical protein